MERRLLPARWQVLSGSWLKVIAMLSMLVDHTASRVLRYCEGFVDPLYTIGHTQVSWYFLMRCVGRLAFPLFAFLLVEGFIHTHDRRKYGSNLLLFALISEIPWNLTHGGHLYGPSQNVLFTLFLGFLALCLVGQWEQGHVSTKRFALGLFGLIIFNIILRADYGNFGIGFILLLYVLRRNRILQAAIGCTYLSMRWIAGLAFIPINLYNGRRGFIRGQFGKYLFYVFYPLHLLVLYFVSRAVTG